MAKVKKHLLLGVGEVGSALKKILEKKVDLYWYDINPEIKDNLPESLRSVDVLHITIPQGDDFLKVCKKYAKKYDPKLIVNHSTTVVGTTKKLGLKAVHTPILGQHNNLFRHIMTFEKAVGPNSNTAKKLARTYLSHIFKIKFFHSSQTTEAAKIISLTKFAAAIEMARYTKCFCDSLKLDYEEVNDEFSKIYNQGYKKNKLENFIQPILFPPKGRIGGTCVIPGVLKSKKVLNSKILDEILQEKEG